MGYHDLPKILSVDVARFGADQSIIGWRQGRKFVIKKKLRGLDLMSLASKVAEEIELEKPDAVVVDGDGLGAGVVDNLRYRGYGQGLFEFHGNSTPDRPEMYYNKRAEGWGLTREWLQGGAEIPNDPELASDLTSPCYGFSAKQQIQIEKKEDMKKRGLQSPDNADCLMMSFAVKLASKMPVNKYVTSYEFPNQHNERWMN